MSDRGMNGDTTMTTQTPFAGTCQCGSQHLGPYADKPDIVQVVQDYVPLKRAGKSYKGLCPFHSDKTPSFHVNRDKGFFTALAAAWVGT